MSSYQPTLNFPWKMYPTSNLGNIVSDYNSYDVYRKQTLALYHYLQTSEILELDKLVVYFAIGDPMEEQHNNPNYEIFDQWKQLFPTFIEETTTQFRTEIIIITPNVMCNPGFIDKTKNKFKWQKCSDLQDCSDTSHIKYISTLYQVTIHIFLTLFPSLDENNSKFINNLNKIITNQDYANILCDHVNNLVQTNEDQSFLNTFNQVFENFVTRIKESGVIFCNYLAVFNNATNYATYNNFYFAPILKSLFCNFHNEENIKSLLFSWIYVLTNTSIFLYLPFCLDYNFSYINEHKYNLLNLKVIQEDTNLKIIVFDNKKREYDTIINFLKELKYINKINRTNFK